MYNQPKSKQIRQTKHTSTLRLNGTYMC